MTLYAGTLILVIIIPTCFQLILIVLINSINNDGRIS
jgi:hypothetical protein